MRPTNNHGIRFTAVALVLALAATPAAALPNEAAPTPETAAAAETESEVTNQQPGDGEPDAEDTDEPAEDGPVIELPASPGQKTPQDAQEGDGGPDDDSAQPAEDAAAVVPTLSNDIEPWAESLNWAEWKLSQRRSSPGQTLTGTPGSSIEVAYTVQVRSTPRMHTSIQGEFTVGNTGATDARYELSMKNVADDRDPVSMTCKWDVLGSSSTGRTRTVDIAAGSATLVSFVCEEYDRTGANRRLELTGRIDGSTDAKDSASLEMSYSDQDEHVIYTGRIVYAGAAGEEAKITSFDGWSADVPVTRSYTVPGSGCDETQGSSVILEITGDEPEKLAHFLPAKVCASTPVATPSTSALITAVSAVKEEPASAATQRLARTGGESTPLLLIGGALLLSGLGVSLLAARLRRAA